MKLFISSNNFLRTRWPLLLVLTLPFLSCSITRSSYYPGKKYSPAELQEDYSVFRSTLEESHPSLYWYTDKEEMDAYFNWGASKLTDSLNEESFRRVLTYVIARINCGHTVVRSSRQALRYRDSSRRAFFPLGLKFWPDTTAVTGNLNRQDSTLVPGTVITRINGLPTDYYIDTFFRYISSDGYNTTHKYQVLSNRGVFGSSHTSLFGMRPYYRFHYIDSTGIEKEVQVPAYMPRRDTSAQIEEEPPRIKKKEERRRIIEFTRNLQFEPDTKTALMDLGSFGRSLQLKRFFRQSFRRIRKSGMENLVIDMRGNGGGSVTNSTLLTRFIADKKFRIADSLYAINRNSSYSKHIEGYFFNRLFMLMMTRKHPDGRYHFGYFERHFFKPKKKNHFDGKVYVLLGGNSFSATTLFAQTVKAQENVVLVGEETGGGAYGNTAWLIPEAVLPVTRIRFRLPLFRLVMNASYPKDGRGVLPEVEAGPTVEAIKRGADYKMEKVWELIRNQGPTPAPH